MIPAGAAVPVIFSVVEAAKILRISEAQMRELIRRQEIPVVRYSALKGARTYLELNDLREYIARHKTPVASNGREK